MYFSLLPFRQWISFSFRNLSLENLCRGSNLGDCRVWICIEPFPPSCPPTPFLIITLVSDLLQLNLDLMIVEHTMRLRLKSSFKYSHAFIPPTPLGRPFESQAEQRRGQSHHRKHRSKENETIPSFWQLQIFFVLLNQNILLWNILINAVPREIWSFHILSNSNLSFTSISRLAHPLSHEHRERRTEKLVLNVRFVRTTIDWYTHKCFDINNIITQNRIALNERLLFSVGYSNAAQRVDRFCDSSTS